MKRSYAFVFSVCLVFSLLLVVSGCAKKAPAPPPVPEKKEVKKDTSIEEGSLPGSTGESMSSSGPGEEFTAAREIPASGTFRATSDLATVHFDFDKYTVRENDITILDKDASWLKNHPNTFVQIEGHCDSRGTPDYNLALGDRRSNAAKNYLLSVGVDPSRISVISYGEEKPLCVEKDESCMSQNRRAEFLVSE